MPDIEIRQLNTEERLPVMYALNMYAFRPSPPFSSYEEYTRYNRPRQGWIYYALYEDGQPMAGAASTCMQQNVRGAIFPMAGIRAVATHPYGRRKGYARAVLAALLTAERQNGRIFTCLYPFRESFYERLGYVTFTIPMWARFETRALLPLLKRDYQGQVELKLFSEAFDEYEAFTRQLMPGIHGWSEFSYPDSTWAAIDPHWIALARFDGQLEGLMIYALQGSELASFTLQALRFYYRSSRARYLLLDWIARHIDQAVHAELSLSPLEKPETWLADLAPRRESVSRAPMGRVLEVAGLSGKLPVGPGSFSARLSDPFCPWNEGTWRFESQNGLLYVSLASQADCNLTIHGLTALIYGTHDPQDFALRGWGDPSPEVQEIMRTIFPPAIPYLHEMF